MFAIIGAVVIGLLFFFVLLPILKNLLGNLINFLISAAIIVGVIALCIAFPPLILAIIGIVIFGKLKDSSDTKETE